MIVTAQKNISYDVNTIRDTLAELNQIPFEDTSIDEALEIIWGYIVEDFGDSYGVVLVDEEGKEV